MTFFMVLLLSSMILGLVALASNPSPYFSALGLVVVAGVGCGLLSHHGATFLSLVVFLIYLGGMLVVFAYTAALAAEPYPETWGSEPVAYNFIVYVVVMVVVSSMFWGGWYSFSWVFVEELSELVSLRADLGGVGLLYSEGGFMLVVGGGVLLLTLFVVLELTRGSSRGALRAV